jgi:peptidoglycan/xylan/chitin deacetylase (PgdA/CDA1 family)
MMIRMGVSRRDILAAFGGCIVASAATSEQSRIAITMDDLRWQDIPAAMRKDADQRLRAALDRHKVKAALFVIGENGDTPEGRAILQEWSGRGHMIGNHTWSHRSIDAKPEGIESMPEEQFGADILRCDAFVRQFPTFRPYLRFPMLKEGGTRERRDWMRAFLKAHGYRNGAVTIDASDWYYDQRLRKCLEARPKFDANLFREPYLAHLWDRATYYDRLAREVLGRSIPHTILLHYNVLNSHFLGDAMDMFHMRGWQLVDAERAFQDEVFMRQPDTVPAGESLVWALAKETGRYDSVLRYPGEDDVYEKPKLDALGL